MVPHGYDYDDRRGWILAKEASRDTGLDTTRGNQAEVEVQHLRVKGKLPFPDFDEEERVRLEDILDVPPKGSPNHQPREPVAKGTASSK
jgi:hypothetical protein